MQKSIRKMLLMLATKNRNVGYQKDDTAML